MFVGAASLADSNKFISALGKNPKGQLEHPWLGELPLVYEDHSQNISTKRGLVKLSLSFVRDGITPTITAPTLTSSADHATNVETISSRSFANDVEQMSVADINTTQANYRGALNALVDITSRMNLADDNHQDTNHAINEAINSVSNLNNEPVAFSESFSTAVDTVATNVRTEPTSPNQVVDNSRSAQAFMLNPVKADSPTSHFNTQMVTGAVKISRDLSELERANSFDITTTQVSTMESVELYDSLV